MKHNRRIIIIICSVAVILVSAIVSIVVLTGRKAPDPTIDTYPNDNSVYSAKVIENVLAPIEATVREAVTPQGEEIFKATVDAAAADSYEMCIYTNGDSHDLYMRDPVSGEFYMVYEGFAPKGNPNVYRYMLDGVPVYMIHIPQDTSTAIYIWQDNLPLIQCMDYDMHDVDLDGTSEIVAYTGEDGKTVVLVDVTRQGCYSCDIAQAAHADTVSFYYRNRLSCFECRTDGGYPAFYMLRDGDLVERERQLAVYEDYLLPNSSNQRLSYSDLYILYSSTVSYAYNEIAARHGCIFEDTEFAGYFSAARWYRPVEGFSEKDLTSVELYNTITIRSYMNNVNANTYNSNADYSKADLDADGDQEQIALTDGTLHVDEQQLSVTGNMNPMYFHVVDINIEIPGFQVAVVGYNSEGKFVMELFDFADSTLSSTGVIYGYTDISYPGNGRIAAKMPCGLLYDQIMQDITEVYTLTEGKLLPEATEAYYLVQLLETAVELELHSSMSTSSDAVKVAPDTEVVVLATDRANWLFIQAETGETGWLYCQDGKAGGRAIEECFYDLIGGY